MFFWDLVFFLLLKVRLRLIHVDCVKCSSSVPLTSVLVYASIQNTGTRVSVYIGASTDPHLLEHLIESQFKILTISWALNCFLSVFLICIFLIINEDDHLFLFILVFGISCFENDYQVLSQFLLLLCRNSAYHHPPALPLPAIAIKCFKY